ncbi:hypothetical protein [Paenibacillus glucanolyticus]|uniref:hypothetical protein n=1 Tax=Paenibacillus glucanolyticus TaxID=59843 RepID=UPI00096CEC9D|nr:hypothetical protein [Paenibacillus glucanolyticus]OMF76649.1 hypothetical protein BK142_14075 [Paenibacillus glucanolyticus]
MVINEDSLTIQEFADKISTFDRLVISKCFFQEGYLSAVSWIKVISQPEIQLTNTTIKFSGIGTDSRLTEYSEIDFNELDFPNPFFTPMNSCSGFIIKGKQNAYYFVES